MPLPPTAVSPARVFAELVSSPKDDEPPRAAEGGPFGREVHVNGSAELSAGPDRAKVTVYLRSRKGEAGAARGSVTRRLDYVTQTVRQRGGISENDVTVTKNFSRIENAYKMEAEVCIIFTDFGKMQDTCNHLVEKLDKSVIISSPHFYHTMEAVDTLRRQVCVSAVRSAQQKAQEVCQLFGHSVGKPLLIKEEEVKESEGHLEDHTDNSPDLFSFQQKLQSATIHISSRVFAIFEIKGEKRKKAALIKGN
ncbi:interleukin-1 receptor-associated kinase 1-binding protein 1 isoform X1 [Notechis scutatus]|uniref:Interleukin-1 receptor-associated kinase 1-binding protein 1 isoform X1 n=1 Tax=Notechis scutatus TaxID=8663 RepID=A0A6J1TSH2_9SAUR|nr:interleukin-1 receptor-associated kinase 1-binding protein 1 isoform X1 [Notechis scutatus]